jgi:hypothetical protein
VGTPVPKALDDPGLPAGTSGVVVAEVVYDGDAAEVVGALP